MGRSSRGIVVNVMGGICILKYRSVEKSHTFCRVGSLWLVCHCVGEGGGGSFKDDLLLFLKAPLKRFFIV